MAAPAVDADAAALAADLRTAPFVRLLASPDGDALAAAGTLARALRETGVPFQVRVADVPATGGADSVTVAVGSDGSTVGPGAPDAPADGDARDDALAPDHVVASVPASLRAHEVARELGAEPDPTLTLAGVVAAERTPGSDGESLLRAAGDDVRRRPGVAVPTADLGDGLAHSTLVHGPFSGDVERAGALLAELSLPADPGDDARRRLASLVAVEAASAEAASPRAATGVERLLRPYETAAPFATVGGFADVLSAVAREAPGAGVALALGGAAEAARTAALDAWRSHARAAHRAVRGAEFARHGGLTVARIGRLAAGRLPTVARLVRDLRAPEPVALAVACVRPARSGATAADATPAANGEAEAGADDHAYAAAAASVEDRGLGAAVAEAARAVGGAGRGRERTAEARFGPVDADPPAGDVSGADVDAFVEAVRGVLA
jgi:hypothetical protein